MIDNKNIKSWKDVWIGPFRYDGFGYIHSKNDVMTFTVDMDVNPESPFVMNLIKDILNALNDKEITNKYEGLTIKDGCDLYYYGRMIGFFRGWGHLTGTGSYALGLSKERATELQDEMIKYVMEKISNGEDQQVIWKQRES